MTVSTGYDLYCIKIYISLCSTNRCHRARNRKFLLLFAESKYRNLCTSCEKPASCYNTDKYYGREGALMCLTDGMGDVAWVRLRDARVHFKVIFKLAFKVIVKLAYDQFNRDVLETTNKRKKNRSRFKSIAKIIIETERFQSDLYANSFTLQSEIILRKMFRCQKFSKFLLI